VLVGSNKLCEMWSVLVRNCDRIRDHVRVRDSVCVRDRHRVRVRVRISGSVSISVRISVSVRGRVSDRVGGNVLDRASVRMCACVRACTNPAFAHVHPWLPLVFILSHICCLRADLSRSLSWLPLLCHRRWNAT
jgi:hypothetical protein